MTELDSLDPFDTLVEELTAKTNDSDLTKSKAQFAVMRFLARREYSQFELSHRLKQKGFDQEIISELLQELDQADWQSDWRCAEMLLNHGYKSGWGPLKIRMQMQQKGIASGIIAEVFSEFKDDRPTNISQQSLVNNLASESKSSQLATLQDIINNYQSEDATRIAQLDAEPKDWYAKALEVATKKFGLDFGVNLEKNIKNKAKLQRFLYNKGFESEHISFVIKNYNS